MTEADEGHTCERCGRVRPAGWSCACGGEGQGAAAPAELAERDPATTRSERPRLRLVSRPTPTHAAGGHPKPSGSPPVDQGSG